MAESAALIRVRLVGGTADGHVVTVPDRWAVLLVTMVEGIAALGPQLPADAGKHRDDASTADVLNGVQQRPATPTAETLALLESFHQRWELYRWDDEQEDEAADRVYVCQRPARADTGELK